MVQPLCDPRERQDLHACGRQLDRKWQAVEPPADFGDLAVRREVGADGCGPLHEELDRLLLAKRVDGDLPLSVDVKRLAARYQHSQLRTGADRVGDARRRVE